MIRLWAKIANQLGITQENALLLHALLSGWLNVLGRRKAYIVVSDIVERFQLDDGDYSLSYAKQLLDKGILTPTEAEVFAGNYHEDNSGTDTPGASQERGTVDPDRGIAGTPARAAAG
jgi:hypothetical protein